MYYRFRRRKLHCHMARNYAKDIR